MIFILRFSTLLYHIGHTLYSTFLLNRKFRYLFFYSSETNATLGFFFLLSRFLIFDFLFFFFFSVLLNDRLVQSHTPLQ